MGVSSNAAWVVEMQSTDQPVYECKCKWSYSNVLEPKVKLT